MKYSDSLLRVLDYAAYDCGQRGQSEIEVDHLLLALFRADFPLLDEILATFSVDSMVLLQRLLEGNPAVAEPREEGEVQLGPEALRVIATAEEEATALGHAFLAAPHALIGILAHDRVQLRRFFVRGSIVHRREEKVLGQVRELVQWLRFGDDSRVERGLEVVDDRTVVRLESTPLGQRTGFAIHVRMLKQFALEPFPRRR